MSPIAYKIDDKIIDTQTAKEKALEGEAIELEDTPLALEVLRHQRTPNGTSDQAVISRCEIYVGPVVKEG